MLRSTSGGRRVLITGGAGFIGAHLVRRCLERGDDVHVLGRPTTDLGRLHAERGAISFHCLRLTDRPALGACLAASRPDEIYHLAADTGLNRARAVPGAQASVGDELGGLLTLIAAAADAPLPPRVLVRAGSIAEYGFAATLSGETQRERPETVYAAALVAGTHYAGMLAANLPYRIVTARLALVHGPGQGLRFLAAQLVDACLSGRQVTMHRPADQRDMLHVDDAVDGLCRLAATRAGDPAIVNLCTGIRVSMAELAAAVLAATGADAGMIRAAPASDGRGGEEPPPTILVADPALAASRLGWRASLTLAGGLARTVAAERAQRLAVAC